MASWLKDTPMKEEEKRQDFSEEYQSCLPQARALAKGGKLSEACELLLAVEKKARLANDLPTMKSTARSILQMCFESGDWEILGVQITLLCKRRGQKSQLITQVIQDAMEYVEKAPNEEVKTSLIETTRSIAAGKIFVEKERAILTKWLAKIMEEKGQVAEAADTLQEVHVETYGAMTKLEKAEYILEQMRLTLAKDDFVRANIVGKKINRKTLEEEGFEDCKVKFYKQMIEYDTHENNTLDLARHWLAIYNTGKIKEDNTKWQEALSHVAIFLCLSPFDNHQNDLMVNLLQDKKLEELPAFRSLIHLFVDAEIMPYPVPDENVVTAHAVFKSPERGQEWLRMLRTRVIEHNLRVIAGYYHKVRLPHLASMLGLSEEETEQFVSKLVSNGTIYAKIDRPAKIIGFTRPQSPDEQLTKWAADISELLNLVETTSHLINKENMLHKI